MVPSLDDLRRRHTALARFDGRFRVAERLLLPAPMAQPGEVVAGAELGA